MDLVNEDRESKLFTEKRVEDFAKRGCHLIYGVTARIPDSKLGEFTTMAIALTPDVAVSKCNALTGDAIECWVMDGDVAVESEKWDPKFFAEHFKDLVGIEVHKSEESLPNAGEGDDDEDDEDGGFTPDVDPLSVINPNTMINKAMMQILDCSEMIGRVTIATSFASGHPMDFEKLLPEVQNSVAKVLYSFAFTKGGYEPKFRKQGAVMLPYWTKQQIKTAKIDPEN